MTTTTFTFRRVGCAYRTSKHTTRWGGMVVYPTLDRAAFQIAGMGFQFPGRFATVAEAKAKARTIGATFAAAATIEQFRAAVLVWGGQH